jgi:ankyrin repeat protein
LSLTSNRTIIQMLLDAKADVNTPNRRPVLTTACLDLQPAALKMLLDAGAPLSTGNHSLNNPLWLAIATKCSKEQEADKAVVVDMLLSAGANPRSVGRGLSILHVWTCTELHSSSLQNLLLRRDPGLLECRDRGGNTPLLYAIEHRVDMPDRLKKVKLLIAAGASVLSSTSEGMTALMLAAGSSHLTASLSSKIVTCLLDQVVADADAPARAPAGRPKKRARMSYY